MSSSPITRKRIPETQKPNLKNDLKNDWTLIPSQRNITLKWEALCGDHVACKHPVNQDKVGAAHAAELATAVEGLYKKLHNGFWTDSNGKKRNKIFESITKVRLAWLRWGTVQFCLFSM